jgi:RHS repeat-associated protein
MSRLPRLASQLILGTLALLATGLGRGLEAQRIKPLAAGGVEVTPDGGSDPVRNPLGEYSTTFTVKNTGTFQYTFTLTCGRTGQVTSCTNDLENITLAAGASGNVPVQYQTSGTAGSGTVTLTASRTGTSDQGSVNVTVLPTAAPVVALRHHNRDHQDRSQCLTTGGVGEAAAVTCGQLVVTHSTPGYATMGRTRGTTLLYHSGQAMPGGVVAVEVKQAATAATPTSVYLQLDLNGLRRDSATYESATWGGPYGTQTRQAVLWFVDTTLATGVYPISVLVQNNFTGLASKSTTIYDTLIVVNRAMGSRFGTGWSLVGVERLHLSQPAGSNHILWVGGDGSAQWYRQLDATHWLAPAGDYRDTLTLQGGEYVRTLRHGVKVVFNAQGLHVRTVNRTAQATRFFWTVDSTRLDSVRVAPNLGPSGTGTTYRLTYGAGGRLTGITDPAGRVLAANYTGARLTGLTDPDTSVATVFSYGEGGSFPTLLTGRTSRRGFKAHFRYQINRVTRDSVPHDTLSTVHAVTGQTPWDSRGMAQHPHSTLQVAVDTAQAYTLISGPRPGIPDDARFWLDRWGAPTQIVGAINDTTRIYRGSAMAPALVTRVVAPDKRTDSLTYDARGNLLTHRVTFAGDTTPRVTRWTYGDANAPFSPDSAIDVAGVVTRFRYNQWGLDSLVFEPNGHITRFQYRPVASDSLQGLLAAVWDSALVLYLDSTSVKTPVPRVHTGFAYNSLGNVVADTSAGGKVRLLQRDSAQRVTQVTDPAGHVTSYRYDALNRMLVSRAHPPSGAPDTTRYVYQLDVLAGIIDPRGVPRSWRYDPLGRVIAEIDDFGAQEKRWYGLGGQLDSLKRREGSVIRLAYDTAGRQVRMAYPARVVNDSTIPGDSIVYSYDLAGRVTRIKGTRDSVLRTYHPSGLLASEVSRNGGVFTMTYAYDLAGRRTLLQIGTPDNPSERDDVTYRYRATDGTLQYIVVQWRGGTHRDSVYFAWDRLGRRDSLHYSNGLKVRFAYDADGVRRLQCSDGPDGSGDRAFDFRYHVNRVDADGQPVKVNFGGLASCGGPYLPFANDTSAVDYRHQLVYRTYSGSVESWQHDASGNRITYDRAGYPRIFDFMLSGHNQLRRSGSFLLPGGLVTDTTGGEGGGGSGSDGSYTLFAYDANGARLVDSSCGGGTCLPAGRYFYDGQGRPAGRQERRVINGVLQWDGPLCLYDVLGRQLATCAAPGAYRVSLGYDGANIVRTGSDHQNGAWTFVHGPGVDDPLFGSNGSRTHAYVTDGAGRQYAVGELDGDAAVLTSTGATAAGAVEQGTTFDAARLSNPTVPGISFFRNRWYDQATGRWTQEDPIGIAGGLNLYQFNGNNPLTYTDPFGLCPDPKDPDCREKVATLKVGATLGLKYEAKLGVVKGELFIGATASGGVQQDRVLPNGGADNHLTGGAKLGAGIKLKAFGEGVDLQLGPKVGDEDEIKTTPVEGDGTIGFSGTIPLVWAGPVPIGGPQVSASLNIPAAIRRIGDGLRNLFSGQ